MPGATTSTSLEPYVPHDVMYRPKMGFSVPLSESFRGALRDRVEATVNSEILEDTGYFDRDYLRTVVADHQSGAREHSAIIWSLMMFETFLRRVHEPHDSVSLVPSAVRANAAFGELVGLGQQRVRVPALEAPADARDGAEAARMVATVRDLEESVGRVFERPPLANSGAAALEPGVAVSDPWYYPVYSILTN